ncbi:hypothetical protein EON77_21495 [bacterium]|nr:MAG: hypothetical protein EON77_21495 [bacterium]
MQTTRYEFIGWDALIYEWAPKALGAVLILLAAWLVGKAVKWALARGINRIPGASVTSGLSANRGSSRASETSKTPSPRIACAQNEVSRRASYSSTPTLAMNRWRFSSMIPTSESGAPHTSEAYCASSRIPSSRATSSS